MAAPLSGRAPVPSRLEETSAEQFAAVDMRVGTVRRCERLLEARKPAYRLLVDLGALGTVRSAARLVDLYSPEELIGTQVICVVNLPPRQVGPVRSEVLILGAYLEATERVVLLRPDRPCRDGDRIG